MHADFNLIKAIEFVNEFTVTADRVSVARYLQNRQFFRYAFLIFSLVDLRQPAEKTLIEIV